MPSPANVRVEGKLTAGNRTSRKDNWTRQTTLTRASYTATAIFLCLAAGYAGTLLLTVAAVGSEDLVAALAIPGFLFSVVCRLLGVIACVGGVAVLNTPSRFRNLATPLAWGLALVVAGVVLRDVLALEDSSVLLWSVSLGLITAHVAAAMIVRSAAISVSTR